MKLKSLLMKAVIQPSFEIPGMPGANVGMINIGEMLGKSMGTKQKKEKCQ